MFGDSESFNDHFPLVRKLLVRPVVAAFLVTTTARGADGSPMATVVTREDGILVWMGWKSILGHPHSTPDRHRHIYCHPPLPTGASKAESARRTGDQHRKSGLCRATGSHRRRSSRR